MGKMIKPTSKTEFARAELLKKRLSEGFAGVTQEMLNSALESARSLLEFEMKVSCERFEKAHGAEDWYKCMRAMYEIVEDNHEWRIISKTRDWSVEKGWVAGSRWEAEDKVNQLMVWQRNAIRRGLANPDKHIERGTKILEALGESAC